ncbi:Acyl-CoA-binding domain-containing protein 2 [Raphanus sativus]|uniref:Acyl-CoA-binding domain-containing protein 2-like n=1 Tax=Raphanus sativus TaxID=3726 RepID=A0A9W3D6G5_RAPSA|nr:acyl-CoA-binding domain-containing protein 2-like [Raphanus sativus]KAJ4913503.1 Acyl-CoA-binding domain-containing protein 2 [Raphanus sativus]
MGDWGQLAQSVILGLIFSYLLAKLISIVVTFKEDNLSLTRHHDPEPESNLKPEVDSRGRIVEPSTGEADSLIAEQGSSRGDSVAGGDSEEEEEEDDDDDWEGVESTELDEAFSAATLFVTTAAADRLSQKVPSEVQQQLYGLYKIATEGPCTAPQPSALKITARAKWQAWQKLGAMPPEEAMEKYIEIVTQLYPTWLDGGVKAGSRSKDEAVSNSGGTMGPVFSSLVYEGESENELKIDAIHEFAREGEVENLLKSIESGIPVNAKDSEGRTPLHWAIDRGHLQIAKLLVDKNADVNAKDNEGQTPLHYAVVCDRETIAEFLVKQKANTASKDDEGNSPLDLCETDWPWLRDSAKQTD